MWRQPVDDGACTIEGYEIWADDGAQGAFALLDDTVSASTFSFGVLDLTESLEYRFRIVANNEIGSSYSNIVTSVVADIPATPSNAPSFDPAETNTTSIRVTIDKVVDDGGSPILSYHIQRTEPGGSIFFDVIGSS